MTRVCTKCGVEKPLSAYSQQKRGLHGKTAACKECHSKSANDWNKKNRSRYKNRELMRKFGITLDEYNSLLAAQGGVCAICFSTCPTGRDLAVDHNHVTGKVRGLLCGSCNRALGLLKDSPLVIDNAAKYLRSTT